MTTIDMKRAEHVARAGAPYPYSSATEARRTHQMAAARAFGRYLLWGYLVGAPGFLALFVALGWRTGPVVLLLAGGTAALLVATVFMVPLWKTIGRHRAVLAAYGIETSIYGQVLPTPDEVAERRVRAARGLNLHAEARRALRVYRLVVGLNVVAVTTFWGVAALRITPVDGDISPLAWVLATVAIVGVVLGCVLFAASGRLVAASAGKYTRSRQSAGVAVFILAVALGGAVATAAHDAGFWILPVMLVLVVARWLAVARAHVRRLREFGEAVTPPAA